MNNFPSYTLWPLYLLAGSCLVWLLISSGHFAQVISLLVKYSLAVACKISFAPNTPFVLTLLYFSAVLQFLCCITLLYFFVIKHSFMWVVSFSTLPCKLSEGKDICLVHYLNSSTWNSAWDIIGCIIFVEWMHCVVS